MHTILSEIPMYKKSTGKMQFSYFLNPNFQKNRLFGILFISLERLKKWLSIVVYIDYIHVKTIK